jgi:hypothetical protein
MKYFRSDQAAIHVSIEGVTLDGISWDVMEAGDNTVEGLVVHPGGMAEQVALGGIPKRSPLTVARLWSDTLIAVFKQIDSLAGQAAVTASYVVLNANKTATSNVETYTGVLGTVTRPNYKAGESTDAMLQIAVDLNGALS